MKMKLRKASLEAFVKRIAYYKEKSLADLQLIVPKWAFGTNSDKILNSALHPAFGEYLAFLVETEELVKKSEMFEVNLKTLFTGESLNDGRVATILHRWDNNQFVDPPTVEKHVWKKSKLCLSDGRHRTKTAYLLGRLQIPVAIHTSEIEGVAKMLKLTEV